MTERTYTVVRTYMTGLHILSGIVPLRVRAKIAVAVANGALDNYDSRVYHDRPTGNFYTVMRCAV